MLCLFQATSFDSVSEKCDSDESADVAHLDSVDCQDAQALIGSLLCWGRLRQCCFVKSRYCSA